MASRPHLCSTDMGYLVSAGVSATEQQILCQLQFLALTEAPHSFDMISPTVSLTGTPGCRLSHRSTIAVLLSLVNEREFAFLIKHTVTLGVSRAHSDAIGIEDIFVPILVNTGSSHLV